MFCNQNSGGLPTDFKCNSIFFRYRHVSINLTDTEILFLNLTVTEIFFFIIAPGASHTRRPQLMKFLDDFRPISSHLPYLLSCSNYTFCRCGDNLRLTKNVDSVRAHWDNYISISFHIEWDMIVVTVFLSILHQVE